MDYCNDGGIGYGNGDNGINNCNGNDIDYCNAYVINYCAFNNINCKYDDG